MLDDLRTHDPLPTEEESGWVGADAVASTAR